MARTFVAAMLVAAAVLPLALADGSCGKIPSVSGVDQSPSNPGDWGKCTGAIEGQYAAWSHWCKTAGIGCLECKQPVIDAILREQQPWRERAEAYLSNPKQVQWIVDVGTERARTVARQTMGDVREAMGINY